MTKNMLLEMGITEEQANMILEEIYKEEPENQKITQLEEEKQQMERMYKEKLKKYAVKQALKEAGGKNTKALLALIELEDITMEDDATVTGLDIKALKKEVPYLFEGENKKIQGTGHNTYNRRTEKRNETERQFKKALMRR